MNYDLTDLRVFRAVAETESLSRGAVKSHMAAPSASYRIKNLEHRIGTELFTRDGKGMILTPAGRVLLSHVQTVTSALEHLNADISRFSQGITGTIRLLANSSCLVSLTPHLSDFLVAFPHVNIEMDERRSPDIVQAITVGRAEIGLLAGNIDTGELISVPYGTDRLVAVTASNHPLASRTAIAFADLLPFDFVATGVSSSNYLFLANNAAKLGKRLKVRINVGSFPVVLDLVEGNAGIAVVPQSVADERARLGRIACLLLEDDWACRNQRLVIKQANALPAFAQELVQYLLQKTRQDMDPESLRLL
jgi:DNA-binding transcriptional LysR family regulator